MSAPFREVRDPWRASAGYCISADRNGQLVVIGHEYGAEIYNVVGEFILSYPPEYVEFPIIDIVTDFETKRAYLLNRQGQLIFLDLDKNGDKLNLSASILYKSRNSDLKSLAISSDGSKLALGYMSPGLAIFQKDGTYKRKHPDDGTATKGSYWSVALNGNGSKLYAGSASIDSGLNSVVCYEINQANLTEISIQYRLPIRSFIKQVFFAKNTVWVVAGIWDEMIGAIEDHVIALSETLEEKIWDVRFNDAVTACAVSPERLIIMLSIGYFGKIAMLDGNTGQTIKYEQEIILHTMANDIVIDDDGRAAAVTEDGHLVLFRYSE